MENFAGADWGPLVLQGEQHFGFWIDGASAFPVWPFLHSGTICFVSFPMDSVISSPSTVSYLSLWTVSLLDTIEHNCNFNLVLDSPTVQSVDLHICLELVFSSPFQEEKQNTIA